MTLRARVEYGIRMRFRWRWWLCVPALVVATATAVAACTGDDESFRPEPIFSYDAATFDRVSPPGVVADGTAPSLSCGDAAAAPPRLLVVSGDTPAELAAFNLQSRAVDGRYSSPDGSSAILSATGNSDPWVIDRANDLVTRLDAVDPWKARGTWNVRGDDGDAGSEPIAVVQVACNKAYVLRAGRDRIAIIDPTASGGVPTGYIDLSPLRASGDVGGLDLASAVWVPSKRKVFVAAGNLDPTAIESGRLRCSSIRPSIFAIDVASDAVVSLAGKGAGGSIELAGFEPLFLRYDSALDRLLAVSGGCLSAVAGGLSRFERQLVEQVDLATGAVKTLLADIDVLGNPRPTGFTLLDGDHALFTLGLRTFYWNPREPKLGDELTGPPGAAGGLDRTALDGRGAFAAAQRRVYDDGGSILELLSIPIDPDAGPPRVIGADPFSTPSGRAASLEPWPHR